MLVAEATKTVKEFVCCDMNAPFALHRLYHDRNRLWTNGVRNSL